MHQRSDNRAISGRSRSRPRSRASPGPVVIYPGPGGNKGEYLVAESTNTKRRTDGTIVWSRP